MVFITEGFFEVATPICSVSHFISAIAFVNRHVCFNGNFVEVIT